MLGQGSGKTHVAGVVSARFISQFPDVPGFIAANTYMQLNQSTLKRIRSVWRDYYGWEEWSKTNPKGNYVVGKKPPESFNTKGHDLDSYAGVISFIQGTLVFIGSLDNYKAHDGKEFGWAILDETKDTKEDALKDVILGRLRSPGIFIEGDELNSERKGKPFNPLYIFTTPAKVDWLNSMFSLSDYYDEIMRTAVSDADYFYNESEDLKQTVVIASTYHNQKNLPSNYIETRKQGLSEGQILMLIYAIPFAKSGGEFYKSFDIGLHANNKHAYDSSLPLHITYDFNVVPYITLTIWQMEKEGNIFHLREIKEYCLKSPKNNTLAVTSEFCEDFRDHTEGIFIYGDPSGNQRDTRSQKGYNDYAIIQSTLLQNGFAFKNRVDRKAPSVVGRGNFINAMLEGKQLKSGDYIKISIDSDCKESIADMLYIKEDENGKKKKERASDPDTGQTFEKYGHTSDAMDYLICKLFEKEYAAYQGKKIWTGSSL